MRTRIVCPECHKEMKTLDCSLEARISGTYDPVTKRVVDYDTCNADIDMSPFDFRCPHCNGLVDMHALAEENPEICDHRHIHATRYTDGSEMVKCCDCHAHVEFKPKSVHLLEVANA